MALVFRICFLLYFLKLSAGQGFWTNLRSTDDGLHKLAIRFLSLKCRLSPVISYKSSGVFNYFKIYKEMDNFFLKS